MMQCPCLSGTAVTESLIVLVDTSNKQIKTPVEGIKFNAIGYQRLYQLGL